MQSFPEISWRRLLPGAFCILTASPTFADPCVKVSLVLEGPVRGSTIFLSRLVISDVVKATGHLCYDIPTIQGANIRFKLERGQNVLYDLGQMSGGTTHETNFIDEAELGRATLYVFQRNGGTKHEPFYLTITYGN